MSWFAWLLPLSSGACDAASRYVIKTTEVHKFTLISAGFFFALPIYAIWLMAVGMPIVQKDFWIAVLLHVPLLAWANVLIVEAHRESPLILTMPYLSFTPAFLLLSAPLMSFLASKFSLDWKFGNPTICGAIGVAVLTAGLYLLNVQSGKIGFWAPFRAFAKESGSRKMFLVSIIFAFTANLDYVAFKNANAPLYLLIDHGLVAITIAVLAIIYGTLNRSDGMPMAPMGHYRHLAFYGLVIAASVVFHMLAFVWIPTVSYVIAVKRTGAIILTVLLGIVLGLIFKRKDFVKESEDLKYRVPGTLIMIIGMLVIILWGKTA